MSTAPVTFTAAQRLATTEFSPISTQEDPTQPRLESTGKGLSDPNSSVAVPHVKMGTKKRRIGAKELRMRRAWLGQREVTLVSCVMCRRRKHIDGDKSSYNDAHNSAIRGTAAQTR